MVGLRLELRLDLCHELDLQLRRGLKLALRSWARLDLGKMLLRLGRGLRRNLESWLGLGRSYGLGLRLG